MGHAIVSKKNTLLVTLALLLSNTMAGLDGTIINTALPAIISDLHGIQYIRAGLWRFSFWGWRLRPPYGVN